MFFTINVVTCIALAAGVLALLFAAYHAHRVSSETPGTEKMQEISGAIHEGAMAFLASEYKIIALVVLALVLILVGCGIATGSGEETLLKIAFPDQGVKGLMQKYAPICRA